MLYMNNKPVDNDRESLRLDWFFVPFMLVFVLAGLVVTFWWLVKDPSSATFFGVGDAWIENGPKLFYADYKLDHAELPLWNPLTLCGSPIAGNPQYLLFYPPNVVRSFLTPAATPTNTQMGIWVMVLVHLAAAGLACYALARSHGLSGPASVISAFAFIFSSPMMERTPGHWQFVVMIAWLPLNLLLLRMALTAKSSFTSLKFFLLLGLAYGVTILGGSPHFMVLIGLTLGFYWLIERLFFAAETIVIYRPAKGVRPVRLVVRTLARDGWMGAISVFIALMIASPMLLPAVEMAQFSARGTSTQTDPELVRQPEADWNLFQRLSVYSGTENYEGIRAAGGGVLMLALAALLSRRLREAVLFLLLFLLLLDCSLDEPYFLGRLVVFAAPYRMSSPGRAMLVACLPLGLLAGAGLDALFSREARRRRIVNSLVFLAGTVLVLVTIRLSTNPHPFLPMGKMTVLLPASLAALGLLGIWISEPVILGTLIAMLVMGESLIWNQAHFSRVLTLTPLFSPRSGASLQGPKAFWSTNRRTTAVEPNLRFYDLQPTINGHDPLHLVTVRDVLCPRQPGDEFRRRINDMEVTGLSVRGNSFLKRQFWLTRNYVDGPLPSFATPFPPTTTVFLDSPGTLHVPRVEQSQVTKACVSSDVIEIPIIRPIDPPTVIQSKSSSEELTSATWSTQLPLPPGHASLVIRFSSTCPFEMRSVFVEKPSEAQQLSLMVKYAATGNETLVYEAPAPDFSEMHFGVVPVFGDAEGAVTIHEASLRIDRSDEDTLIKIASRTANTVTLDVGPLVDYRILANIDAYYSGWRAYVDDREVPILKANDAFKAIELGPGKHHVTFEFRPWRVYVGLCAAGAATLCCAIVLSWNLLRNAGTRLAKRRG